MIAQSWLASSICSALPPAARQARHLCAIAPQNGFTV
jgi:hypothetical protein